MNARTAGAIIVAVGAVIFALLFSGGGDGAAGDAPVTASVVNGIQYVDVTAKGGYSPRLIVARAGVTTVLRVTTNGTFDCSSSLVIPSISYQKQLAPKGVEEISITAEQASGVMQGLCSMGMYGFRIQFE